MLWKGTLLDACCSIFFFKERSECTWREVPVVLFFRAVFLLSISLRYVAISVEISVSSSIFFLYENNLILSRTEKISLNIIRLKTYLSECPYNHRLYGCPLSLSRTQLSGHRSSTESDCVPGCVLLDITQFRDIIPQIAASISVVLVEISNRWWMYLWYSWRKLAIRPFFPLFRFLLLLLADVMFTFIVLPNFDISSEVTWEAWKSQCETLWHTVAQKFTRMLV